MIRRTLTILSLIGLLLSIGLWGASYFVLICVHPSLELRIHRGGVEATPVTQLERTSDGWKLTFKNGSETLRFGKDGERWKFIGYFGMHTKWLPWYSSATRRVFIPLWLPILVFSGLLLWSSLPALRRQGRDGHLLEPVGIDLQQPEHPVLAQADEVAVDEEQRAPGQPILAPSNLAGLQLDAAQFRPRGAATARSI